MTEKYISRSPAVAARQLGDEMMIMSAPNSTLFTLNPAATCIWKAADGHTPLSQIVESRICAEFEVDQQTAYRDALEFVQALAQHGLLNVFDEPQPKRDSPGAAP